MTKITSGIIVSPEDFERIALLLESLAGVAGFVAAGGAFKPTDLETLGLSSLLATAIADDMKAAIASTREHSASVETELVLAKAARKEV